MSIADQVIEKYKNQPLPQGINQGGSVADRVISKYGSGNFEQQAEAPVEEQPDSVFGKFTNLVLGVGKGLAQGGVKTMLSIGQLGANVPSLFTNPTKYEEPTPSDLSFQIFGKRVTSAQRSMHEADQKFKAGEMTKKELVGEVIDNAIDLSTFLPMGAGAKVIEKAVGKQTMKMVFKEGAKVGLKYGVPFGAAGGASEALKENMSSVDIAKQTGIGAIGGAVAGTALGVGGGVAGKLFGKIFGKEGGKAGEFIRKVDEVNAKIEPQRPSGTMADIRTNQEPNINLRPETQAKGRFLEDIKRIQDKKPELDINQVLKEAEYVKVVESEQAKLSKVGGGSAKGKARWDFEKEQGEVVLGKGASDATKAHEFAHPLNYKLGGGKEKLTTEIDKYISGQSKEIPIEIKKYAGEKLGKGTPEKEILAKADEITRQISDEIKKASRLNAQVIDKLTSSSEEFATAFSNLFSRGKEVDEIAPMFSDFVRSKVGGRKVKETEFTRALAKVQDKMVKEREIKTSKDYTLPESDRQKTERLAKIKEAKGKKKELATDQKVFKQLAEGEKEVYEKAVEAEMKGDAGVPKLKEVNRGLKKAIQTSEFFRKERAYNENWANATLYQKGDEYRIGWTDLQKRGLVKAGYEQLTGVDRLAQEAGYDDVYKYLDDFVDELNGAENFTKADQIAHDWLVKNNDEYKKIVDEIDTLDNQIKELKQPYESKTTIETTRKEKVTPAEGGEAKRAVPEAREAVKAQPKSEEELAREYVRNKTNKFREPTARGNELSRHIQTLMKRLSSLNEGTASYKNTLKAIRQAEDKMQRLRTQGEKYRIDKSPLIQEARKTSGKDYVTVYHRTDSPVEGFGKGGVFSKENRNEFFVSNKKTGQNEGYGKNVIELRVKKSDLSINDEFPSGEKHYTLDTKKVDEYLKSQPLQEGGKYRLRDDFKKATGISIDEAQETKIIELNKKIFGDENIKITGQILTPDGQKALGAYRDGMVKIMKGQADAVDTFYHESVHKYLDVFTTEDEQVQLLSYAKKLYGSKSYAEAEEKLAENFINYAKTREGASGKMKAIFDSVIERIKSYFGNEDKIKSLYADIIKGEKKIAEPRPVKPVTGGGVVKETIVPIKSKSIRLDKLNTSADVQNAIQKISEADKEVIDRQRRGQITNQELEELSNMTGIRVKDIVNAKPGSIINPENVFATRKMMLNMATDLADSAAKIGINAGKEQMTVFKAKYDTFRGVQKALAGFRSEYGRGLQQFSAKVKAEEYEVMDELIKRIKEIDMTAGTEMERAIKIGKELKPDNLFQLAIKAGVEFRTAALLYSMPTHAANLLGNTWKAVSVPAQKWVGSIISGEKGIARGEASAHIRGVRDAMPEAWKELKADLGNIFTGKEIIGGSEKIKEVTRQRAIKEFMQRLGIKEGKAELTDSILKSSFKLLTAGDKFFRIINFAGELYSQSLRKAKQEGLTGAKLAKRIGELVDNPAIDEDFLKEINNQVDISLFQEKTSVASAVNKLREKAPSTKLIFPFVQTPLNVAMETIRTSPVGFLRPAFNKARGVEMTQANKALAYAQATIGTALSAISLGYIADGKITGSVPKERAARDEFYASGKQPYSVKVGKQWVSYRRVEPLASVLANTVNVYKTMKDEKDMSAAIGKSFAGYSNNFLDQTFLRGISDVYNAISEPDQYGSYFVQNFATSFVPSIIRQTAGALDRTVREKKSMSDAFKNIIPTQKETLPAKVDAFGNEVKGQGGFGEGFLSPFARSIDKNDKVIQELEKSEYNITTLGMDAVGGVKLEGKAKEIWMKAVGQATKKEMDKLVSSRAFENLSQYKKDEALKDTVSRVREKYRDQVLSGGLSMALNNRKKMTKSEKELYNEELAGKLSERIKSMKLR